MVKMNTTRNGNGHARGSAGNGRKAAEVLRITRRASSDAHLKLADRASSDLGQLLAGKSNELVRLLELSEETSRKVVATELDLQREHEVHQRLGDDLAKLEHDLAEAKVVNVARAKKKGELEDESARLRKASDILGRDGDKLADDVAAMAKELKELQAENGALESRRAKLAEDIARLKKLRAEYLGNINKLKSDKDDLVS